MPNERSSSRACHPSRRAPHPAGLARPRSDLPGRPGLSSWLFVALGCTQLTSFDLSAVEETTEALCSDGADNDTDGLTDCQDWKCLDRVVCCDIPAVILYDPFDYEGCARELCDTALSDCVPDAETWQAFGAPLPVLCQGGLSPHKPQQCYDVGVLSRAAVFLRPGLSVQVGVRGRPEERGHLDIGLTLQSEVTGAVDACSPVETALPIFDALQVRSQDGYRFQARFDQQVIALSPEVFGEDRHELALSLGDDRRVHYALDGFEFALSPANVTIPDDIEARLSLTGIGLRALFDDARVTTGTHCDAPGEWGKARRFLALDLGPHWDDEEVFSPDLIEGDQAGEWWLYYVGCPLAEGGCDRLREGVGLATARAGSSFVRETERAPLFYAEEVTFASGTSSFARDVDLAPLRSAGGMRAYVSARTDPTGSIRTLLSENGRDWNAVAEHPLSLVPGSPGSWDDDDICCATAVAVGSEVFLWYSGKSSADGIWRIGLATSADGIVFTKSRANPVLVEGGLGDHDGRGVSAPEVIYDEARRLYRMWYTAQAFRGATTIAYAVSPDGVSWSKYPQNPVITPDEMGLVSLDSASVLALSGQVRMWCEGRGVSPENRRIFALENLGHPSPFALNR